MSNDKLQKILNIILVILLIIIALLFIFSLLGISGILILTEQYEMDALAFVGAIIGGGITYLGVKRTIKHEVDIRKQEKNQNNIKLLNDVLNELRDDIREIESIKNQIDISYEKYLSQFKFGKKIRIFVNQIQKIVKHLPKEDVDKLISSISLTSLIKDTEENMDNKDTEEEQEDIEKLLLDDIRNKTNKFNNKIVKSLNEKIIYFDWEVFENIESNSKKLEKILLDEMFNAKTRKECIEERLNLCIKIMNELKNYQTYLREQMRKN